MSAIIDGNITTLIAAIVLWFMGTGSVKGFAQTLMLGIVLSMFTALVITKMLLNAFYAMGVRDQKWYGVSKERKPINFLAKKGIFFTISAVVIICGFVFMGIHSAKGERAFNFSLEFIGGASTTATFPEDVSIAKLDSEVVPKIEAVTGDGNVQSQKVTGTNEVIFKTSTLESATRTILEEMFVNDFGVA